MSTIRTLAEYYVIARLKRIRKALKWCQPKVIPLLKDIYPDFYCWVTSFSAAEEAHMLRIGEFLTIHNKRCGKDVCLGQLSQSCGLQESF